VAAAAVLLTAAFARRVRYEEQMLTDELGLAYETYSAKIKRFVPGVW
jgi:protein-S-isoprenylcysteine O-methyltransferase Ste14